MIEQWNEQKFKDEIYRDGKLAGVEFFSETCPACRTLGVILDRVSEKYDNTLIFGKINVDSEESLAEKYAIRSVPTFIVFSEGRGVAEQVGAVGQRELSSMIDTAINKVKGKK